MGVTTYTLGYIPKMLSSLANVVESRSLTSQTSMDVVEFCWVVDVRPSPIRYHGVWQLLQEVHTVVEAGEVCLGDLWVESGAIIPPMPCCGCQWRLLGREKSVC